MTSVLQISTFRPSPVRAGQNLPVIRLNTSYNRDPMQYLQAYWPGVVVEFRTDMPSDLLGETIWPADVDEEPVIHIAAGLSPADTRATLCHEIIHLEKGDPDGCSEDELEACIERATARWLLPSAFALKVALKGRSLQAAAEWLTVPVDVLRNRLRHLTEREALQLWG